VTCHVIGLQSGPKSKLSYFVHIMISLLNIVQFSQFFRQETVRNLLLIGMHTTPTMSLHYTVKHKCLKTNNIIQSLVVILPTITA